MEQRCIMGVFAHPDDETFSMAGIFRRYHDQGVRTALVCATRGEVGEISDPFLATAENLGQIREQELREACRIMGVDDLSFLNYRDGTLYEADPAEAVGRLVRQIRRLRPQVIVTFAANGGYGHLDHIAIHRLTVAAFQQAADPTCHPEQIEEGLQPCAPEKLYTVGFARSSMGALRDMAAAGGVSFSPGGNAATIPPEEMGTPDEELTTVVALTDAEYEMKLRALQSHRTQMNPANPINHLPPETTRAWLGAEQFVRLVPPRVPSEGLEHDLFAAITV